MPWATVNQSTNRPSNTGGRLEVIVFSNGVRQFFYNYGSDNSGLKVYFRNFDGATSTWLGWHSLADNNDITSLDNNKANTNHTHNDNSGIVEVNCAYGNVWKFKKNGWAVILWNDLNLTNINKNAWTVIASTGWSNQAGATNHYGTFVTGNTNDNTQRFEVDSNGDLRVFRTAGSTVSVGYYGYIVYPTTD